VFRGPLWRTETREEPVTDRHPDDPPQGGQQPPPATGDSDPAPPAEWWQPHPRQPASEPGPEPPVAQPPWSGPQTGQPWQQAPPQSWEQHPAQQPAQPGSQPWAQPAGATGAPRPWAQPDAGHQPWTPPDPSAQQWAQPGTGPAQERAQPGVGPAQQRAQPGTGPAQQRAQPGAGAVPPQHWGGQQQWAQPGQGWAPGAPGQQPPGQWGQQWGQAPPRVVEGVATGPLPLRPMTFGDIIDGGFKLLKANFRTALLITALFVVPLNLVTAFFQRSVMPVGILEAADDPTILDSGGSPFEAFTSIGTLLALVASLLVTPLVTGAISRVVAASYLGTQLSTGAALRAGARRMWSLLASWFLVHLAEGGPAVAGIAIVVAVGAGLSTSALGAGGDAAIAGVGILAVGLIVIGAAAALFLMPMFVAVAPAIVVEELGPIRALRRSWTLMKPRYWSVLGIAIVSGLLAGVIGWFFDLPFSLVAALIGYENGWWLLAAGSILPELLTTPFIAIVATLVYFDARIRHEGFDLEVIAGELARDGARGR
jgi:hypothetical protein